MRPRTVCGTLPAACRAHPAACLLVGNPAPAPVSSTALPRLLGAAINAAASRRTVAMDTTALAAGR
eukprot:scaffold74941_cov71-Phaeocystis_antarctica.AAC.2